MTPEMTPYQRNTKEQSEALGRFVEAFERMVDEARSLSRSILLDGVTGQTADRDTAYRCPDINHSLELVAIPLHHQTLTAKPIFDIFRALFISTINHSDYQSRSEFFVKRQIVTKAGVRQVKLPKTTAEMYDLCRQCDEVREWIHTIWLCLPHRRKPRHGSKREFRNCFEFSGGKWLCLWPLNGKSLVT
jgi:hypothetical protein